jgi:hypothetical protein
MRDSTSSDRIDIALSMQAVCTVLGRSECDRETVAGMLYPITRARDVDAAKLIAPMWLQIAARMAIHQLSEDDEPQDA